MLHGRGCVIEVPAPGSVGSKPRTRFRAAQENRALSENQPLQRLKSERIQRSIDQEIVVEWPKRVRSAKRKQKAKNQEWTSDFAGMQQVHACLLVCNQSLHAATL